MSDSAPARFLDHRIHLVTGKGGVGRTTVAAGLALAAAAEGKRTLVTEVGDAEGGPSSLGRRFGRERLTPDPEPLGPPGLYGCHIGSVRGQELFGRSVIPAGPLIRAVLSSKALRRFVNAVPSLYELGLFFHLLTLLKEKDDLERPRWEVVVADMPATGQTLGLTALPGILLDALPDGPIPRTMREGQAFLNDPAQTVAWVVTLPELLPVTEALELAEGLRETKVTPGAVLLNRIPEDPFTAQERAALAVVLAQQPMHGAIAFRRIGIAREAESWLREQSELPVVRLPSIAESAPQLPHEGLAETFRSAA